MATGLIVHLEIADGRRDEFAALARAHGERSVRLEEGNCLSFEVFVPAENAQEVILVEKYVDDAALQAHWDSAHMAAYMAQTGSMIVGRTRYLCSV
ncbi:MAG: antibiotic biosynthesis monooxygenase [Caldilinea sp.]|nr:antibiotic biosynthesis monooxygenase [Caldilinea sp.]MCB0147195.1 antibiotic biosynthesis monooxygenase [Caldilineaceae bacterium]MCB9115847.1 antibiotic biosynthesis monooxygenase [Caldilineaceae bacterium]MCB9119875.1 antibiotic biosynthesis monooxygenase [Caldilineaceae bacterium]MCB9124428.1 antibiotic biosynthesis monooxygenase [Caldilineaceae bacterium]